MPFTHDRPSLEHSPDEHDATAIEPGSTLQDVAALLDWLQVAPHGPVLDIGCGTGRHVRALCAEGLHAIGLDLDERMITTARSADPGAPVDRYRIGDGAGFGFTERFALISLLNRSLVCFHSHLQASGLFACVARHLLPGGLFVIDNCCTFLWDQVKEGCFADGLSEDGNEQLIFVRGENRFTWRHDEEVDPTCWDIRPSDRLYRLWSLGEVALAASGAGLVIRCAEADEPFIVVQAPLRT